MIEYDTLTGSELFTKRAESGDMTQKLEKVHVEPIVVVRAIVLFSSHDAVLPAHCPIIATCSTSSSLASLPCF
jgi:hypothetical protein